MTSNLKKDPWSTIDGTHVPSTKYSKEADEEKEIKGKRRSAVQISYDIFVLLDSDYIVLGFG